MKINTFVQLAVAFALLLLPAALRAEEGAALKDYLQRQILFFGNVSSSFIRWKVSESRFGYVDNIDYYTKGDKRRVEFKRVEKDGKVSIKWVSVNNCNESRRLNVLSGVLDIYDLQIGFLPWTPPIFGDLVFISPPVLQIKPYFWTKDFFSTGGFDVDALRTISYSPKSESQNVYLLQRGNIILEYDFGKNKFEVQSINISRQKEATFASVPLSRFKIIKRSVLELSGTESVNIPSVVKWDVFNTQPLAPDDVGFPDNIIESTVWEIGKLEINTVLDEELFYLASDEAQGVQYFKAKKDKIEYNK